MLIRVKDLIVKIAVQEDPQVVTVKTILNPVLVVARVSLVAVVIDN